MPLPIRSTRDSADPLLHYYYVVSLIKIHINSKHSREKTHRNYPTTMLISSSHTKKNVKSRSRLNVSHPHGDLMMRDAGVMKQSMGALLFVIEPKWVTFMRRWLRSLRASSMGLNGGNEKCGRWLRSTQIDFRRSHTDTPSSEHTTACDCASQFRCDHSEARAVETLRLMSSITFRNRFQHRI